MLLYPAYVIGSADAHLIVSDAICTDNLPVTRRVVINPDVRSGFELTLYYSAGEVMRRATLRRG